MIALRKEDREGADGAYLNVMDCDDEARATVWAADPDTYRLCWPDAPDLANGRADT
jgi:hypothetical protein